jgi:predicted nuclease of restriction endonuclease-like RecB superfamily
MLTSEQSIVSYEQGQALPDRLTRVTHRHYLDYAQRMMLVYQRGVGSTRRELHKAIEAVLSGEPDCTRRRIAAFCKLLDDAGEFDQDRRGDAAELRLRVFSMAAPYHPLVCEPDQIFERSEREAKGLIAAEIGRPWESIEAALYKDVTSYQPLKAFAGFTSAEALLSRYNLAQLQACLYKARSMTVEASADFATIIRYAKLARLLVEARRVADEPGSKERYRIDLSGPSSVLHETRRYGVNFARFVSALVACQGWRMKAVLTTRWGGEAQVRATCDDGYRSHLPSPAEFDSAVEEALANKWGDSRDGWRLLRDAGILQEGQVTFVPDFLLRHADGREAFLEIVGFWTPEYLAAKRRTVAMFRNRRIVLAVPRRTAKENAGGPGVVIYKTRIKPDEVVRAVEGLA